MIPSEMSEADSTMLGLLVASAVPPFMSMLSMLVGGGPDADIGFALVMAILLYFFSFPIVFILGGPLFMAFRYFRLVRWWSATASGLVVCALIAAYLRHPDSIQPSDLPPILTGAFTGLVFWAIWRRGC